MPESVWRRFDAVGALGAGIPEAYGGAGEGFCYLAIAVEEHVRAGMAAPAFEPHTGIVAPYIVRQGTEAQKRDWLPRVASYKVMASIGMTEPNSGSDLAAVRTRAVRNGDHHVVKGFKVFITNGIVGDLIVLVVKTAPELKAKGVSLLLVDTSLAGYRKARNLKKVGNKAQDTAELCFDDVRVPADYWHRKDAPAMAAWEHGGGFSVDAAVRIEPFDRDRLERLLRYCARPAFPLSKSNRNCAWSGFIGVLSLSRAGAPCARRSWCHRTRVLC